MISTRAPAWLHHVCEILSAVRDTSTTGRFEKWIVQKFKRFSKLWSETGFALDTCSRVQICNKNRSKKNCKEWVHSPALLGVRQKDDDNTNNCTHIDPSVCGKRHSFGKSQFKKVENIGKKPHLSHWIYLNDWFVSLPKVIKTCNVSYDDRGLKICQIWWRITLYSPKKKSHLLLIGWYHHMLCPSFSDDWWLLNRSAHGVGVNTSLKDENFVFFSYSLSFLKPCEHFFLDFGVIDISIPDVLLRPPYLNETTMLNGSNDDQIFHFNFLHFIVKSDRSFLMNVVMHLPSVAENSVISIGSQIRLRAIIVKSPFFTITILTTVDSFFENIESNQNNCFTVLSLFMSIMWLMWFCDFHSIIRWIAVHFRKFDFCHFSPDVA